MTSLARRALNGIETRDPELDALRRAARAGLVIPIAGGIGFAVGSGQTPLFAIFGSIALLIVVDFPGNRAGRAVSYAGLGVLGAALITLGTLVAPIPWLAVTTMFVLGVAITFAGVLSSAIAAAQRATLLPFVLPACTPPGPIPERLLGWCIALAVCVPAALFVLPPRHHDDLRRHAARVCAVAGAPTGGPRGRQRRQHRHERALRQLRQQRLPPRRPDGGQPRAGPRGRRPGLAVRPGARRHRRHPGRDDRPRGPGVAGFGATAACGPHLRSRPRPRRTR